MELKYDVGNKFIEKTHHFYDFPVFNSILIFRYWTEIFFSNNFDLQTITKHCFPLKKAIIRIVYSSNYVSYDLIIHKNIYIYTD